jgi:hypothetical protein
MTELRTTAEAAEHIATATLRLQHVLGDGATAPVRRMRVRRVLKALPGVGDATARRTLGRAGIRPVARRPGRAGLSLYDAEQIRAWHASRPGSGR